MTESNDREIFKELGGIKETLGKVEGQLTEFIRNTNAYVGAVSKKADDIRTDITLHKESQEAHGVAGERRGRAAVFGALGAIIGGLGSTVAVIGFLYRIGILK